MADESDRDRADTEAPDFEPYQDMVPKSAMPLFGLRLVRFIGDDGESYLQFESEGDQMIATIVGDLYRIAHAFMDADDPLTPTSEDDDQ